MIPIQPAPAPQQGPMERDDLTLVVPTFNEARRLDVTAFAAALHTNPRLSFLFVDDGSTDNTPALLATLAEQLGDRAALLALPSNLGKAAAVRAGLGHLLTSDATPLVGYWDADLATPLETLPDFLGVLDRQPEIQVVMGARIQLMGRRIRRRALRHYLGRVFATAASISLGLPVYDTQCGAKVFRRTPALAKALAKPWVSRWIFDVELLDRLVHDQGVPPAAIWELPLVAWHDVAGSKLSAWDFLLAPLELWRIRAQRGSTR